VVAEAEEFVRRALKLYPRDATFHHRLAELLKRQGKSEAARLHADAAVRFDSSINVAQMLLAGLFIDVSDFVKASEQIEDLRKQSLSARKLVILRHIEAEMLIKKGEFETARQLLSQDVARERDAAYYGLLARAYRAEGDSSVNAGHSRECYERALEVCEAGLHFDEENVLLSIQAEELRERLATSS
jgi:tetratricopeptide (TPR) repeat protein